jgi:hypothetical protein
VSVAARREKTKIKILDSSSAAVLKNRGDKNLSDMKNRHHAETCLLSICEYTGKEVLGELIIRKMRFVGLQ